MKNAGLVCLFLVVLVAVAVAEARMLNPGVLDPCLQDGNIPGCHDRTKPREKVNSHNRGCSAIFRCRGGTSPSTAKPKNTA